MPPRRQPRRGNATRRGRGRGNAAAVEQSGQIDAEDSELTVTTPKAQEAGVPQSEQLVEHGEAQTQAADPPARTTDADSSAISRSASRPAAPLVDTASASASSPVSRASRGRATLKAQPKNIQRRSKAERDAAADAEAERLRARVAAAAAAAEFEPRRDDFKGRGRDRGRGRGRGGGRGGFMGDMVASGPFSGGVASGFKSNYGPARTRIPGMSSGGSSGDGSRTKKERKIKTDAEGDAMMLDRLGVKREEQDGGYISSDPDEAIEGPRVNVEKLVNLISSEEEDSDEGGPVRRGKRPEKAPMRPIQDFAPIRGLRREHVDRSMGMGADADLPRSGERRGSVGYGEDAIGLQGSDRKARTRNKDVEFIKDERKWKGVYDEDADGHNEIRVKDEPSDDGDEAILVPSDVAMSGAVAGQDTATKENPSSPDARKKSGVRRRAGFREVQPVLQTAHERQEWARRQADLELIRDELGHIELGSGATGGDTEMEGSDIRIKDRKADAVYLFQFPPVLPDLRLASDTVKNEPKAELPANEIADLDLPQANEAAINEPVKIEEDDNAISITGSKSLGPSLASGLAGKLQIHESGRATLSWGGTSLELSMGTDVKFLQDVILTKVTPEAQRVTAADGGEAMAFGQVRGKFIVTPDWNEMF